MKVLLRKIVGPLSIAVATVHWLVVLFALYGEQNTSPLHYTYEPVLTQWLYVIDSVPLLIGGLLLIPVLGIFGDGYISWTFAFVIYVPLITIQWLVVGWLLAEIYRSTVKDRIRYGVFAKR